MERFLTNPRVVVLAIALIVVAGLGAIKTLPRIEDPRITNRHAIVIAHFPGASAERVEALVAEPLEQALREIPEIEHISSSARAGLAALTVQLQDDVYGGAADELWIEVRDKLKEAQAQLPPEVPPPTVDSERGHAFTWIGAITWKGEAARADILRMGRFADELASRLNNLAGTDIVRNAGAPQEEIRVDIDPVQVASVGLDARAVSQRIREHDAKVSAGELYTDQHRMSLEVSGAYERIERIRQLPLLTSENGIALQLGDVAKVYRGEKQPVGEYAVVDGQRAVVVAARMLPDFRGDHWTAALQAELRRFEQDLPVELQLQELFVQERYNAVRLSDLIDNIALGFALIVVVLLFTLGWRSAVIVAAALPLTILFALACMRFADLPIHQMSVTGLIVALGIMVDNAIVAADTVMRYRREGYSAVAAVVQTVRHLWLPLLGSTLTTVLTFMPIVLMPGPAGEFIGGISLTVIFSLVGSWLISLLIIAPVAGKWLSGQQGNGLRIPLLHALFRGSLSLAMRAPRLVVLMVMVLPILGFMLGAKLPEQFFPASDRDMINLELYLPAFAGIEATREATESISALLEEREEIESLHWFIGRSAPSFYYNLKQGNDGRQNYAQAMLTARDFNAANRLVAELQAQLDDAFPQWQVIVRRLEQGPPSDAPVELRLYGTELGQLRALGDDIRRIALETRGVVQVRSSIGEVVPKLWVDMSSIDALVSGAAQTALSAKLQADLDGVVQGSLIEATEQLPVRVRVAGAGTVTMNELQLLPVTLPGGGRPLMALADLRLEPVPAVISRRDGERVNTVQIFIRDGVLPAVVLSRLEQNLAAEGLALPQGYRLEVGGEDENRDRAVGELMGSVGIILVLLIVTVMMAFNSFRFALVIFAVAGQAAGLGMLSLGFSGYPFGFVCIVGLMGLIGLAVNAAIVILAELKDSPAAMAGERQAIVAVVVECTRHIVSTTITTVVGLLPLIMAGGGFWPPFAVVLAGGTVLTTLLSLYFVPAAFLVLRKPYVKTLWQRRRGAQPANDEAPAIVQEEAPAAVASVAEHWQPSGA